LNVAILEGKTKQKNKPDSSSIYPGDGIIRFIR